MPSDRKSHQWNKVEGKSGNYTTRDLVLERDMSNVIHTSRGNVKSGILLEPYTGRTIHFQRGTSDKTEGGSASNHDGGIQIGHVAAYAEAYRSGLDGFTFQQRDAYYNDPDVLLSSQAEANNAKKDGTAAEWLPSNKSFRCDYASLQIGIKAKYGLTVDRAEHDAPAPSALHMPGRKNHLHRPDQRACRVRRGAGRHEAGYESAGTSDVRLVADPTVRLVRHHSASR